MEINETEMQTYIADEHKAMEKELVKAFIENLKEEFKID